MAYSPVWRRAVALVIDLFAYVPLFTAAIFGSDSLLRLELHGLEAHSSILELREWDLRSTLIMVLIKLVIAVAYFAGFESSALQATPGKLLLGLRVADVSGRRISFARAGVRLLGKVLSGACAGAGYLMAALTKRRQALHDLIASTVVLRS